MESIQHRHDNSEKRKIRLINFLKITIKRSMNKNQMDWTVQKNHMRPLMRIEDRIKCRYIFCGFGCLLGDSWQYNKAKIALHFSLYGPPCINYMQYYNIPRAWLFLQNLIRLVTSFLWLQNSIDQAVS